MPKFADNCRLTTKRERALYEILNPEVVALPYTNKLDTLLKQGLTLEQIDTT